MFNAVSSYKRRFAVRDSRKNLLSPLYTINFTTL